MKNHFYVPIPLLFEAAAAAAETDGVFAEISIDDDVLAISAGVSEGDIDIGYSCGEVPIMRIGESFMYEISPERIAPIAFTYQEVAAIGNAIEALSAILCDGFDCSDKVQTHALRELMSDCSALRDDISSFFENLPDS